MTADNEFELFKKNFKTAFLNRIGHKKGDDISDVLNGREEVAEDVFQALNEIGRLKAWPARMNAAVSTIYELLTGIQVEQHSVIAELFGAVAWAAHDYTEEFATKWIEEKYGEEAADEFSERLFNNDE